MAAVLAEGERGHGLVGAARLHLAVDDVVLLALAALEQRGLGALGARHLMVVDGLLGELGAQVLQIVAGHLLGGHDGQPIGRDDAQAHALAQLRILGVLEVDHAAAYAILVLHLGVLELGEDDVLAARRDLLHVAQLGAVLDRLAQLERVLQHLATLQSHLVLGRRERDGARQRIEFLQRGCRRRRRCLSLGHWRRDCLDIL